MQNINPFSEKQLIITEDGSHSLYMPGLDENYHSIHGAVQESNHVFIEAGLKEIIKTRTSAHILEMGFGTGLNAFLTLIYAIENKTDIHYTSLEAYPLDSEITGLLNYGNSIGSGKYESLFNQIHQSPWERPNRLSAGFELTKKQISLIDFILGERFDLVYFDAFAPDVQPELWTAQIFSKMHTCMNPGAILVTYCCKGLVKRNMIGAGFSIEKLPGPPGKREMLRAWK